MALFKPLSAFPLFQEGIIVSILIRQIGHFLANKLMKEEGNLLTLLSLRLIYKLSRVETLKSTALENLISFQAGSHPKSYAFDSFNMTPHAVFSQLGLTLSSGEISINDF